MKTSAGGWGASGWVTAAVAVGLVIGVTVVQGMWTERWGRRDDGGQLGAAAERLERLFPEQFGDWLFEQELDSSAQELERAGAVGHISKLYRNTRTNSRVSAFVVCATPHDASGHTPDRCYPGAGFEIGEAEHRHSVKLPDGNEAETFTATFRKSGQTLRIFWTYGVPADESDTAGRLRWVAPGIARIALSGEAAVYKLYAIIDQTKITSVQATVDCSDFIATLLTDLNERLVAAAHGQGAPPEGAPASDAESESTTAVPAADPQASLPSRPPAG